LSLESGLNILEKINL